METIHIQFDELYGSMAPVQLSTRPAPTFLTPGQISSGLVPNPVPAAPYVLPTNKELEILFQPMFDEYLEPPRVERPVSPALAVSVPVNSAGTPYSTDHYSRMHLLQAITVIFDITNLQVLIKVFATILLSLLDYPFALVDKPSLVIVFTTELVLKHHHLGMQEDEIHEFDRLQVWELVPRPDWVMIIALKWIYKVKLDEYDDVMKKQGKAGGQGISIRGGN
ncbi:hypothetical protein Tco_0610000 [Tanacetum coccineum]